jgi:hypothetical protein
LAPHTLVKGGQHLPKDIYTYIEIHQLQKNR